MEQENTQKTPQQVLPVNRQAKDTFFKTLYASEERQKKLAAFLLGMDINTVTIADVRPVLFGNRENDLSFICNRIYYVLTENQATVSPNVPYREAEYAIAGLRAMVDSEQLLYGRKRVQFPVPKLYMLQTGLEAQGEKLPGKVQYDVRLSDSYMRENGQYEGREIAPDLEVVVHVYDFRMTLDEALDHIENAVLPERFQAYGNDLRDYAMVANGITYIQRAMKECGQENCKYKMPSNVPDVAGFLELMANRGIFVDLLKDKEVCDMTMAQFSRDDIFFYSGKEEGREEGKAEGKAEDVIELLEDLGDVSASTRNLIAEQTDVNVLHRWLKTAARARSVEDFETAAGLVVPGR